MLLQRLGILSLGALALASQSQGDEDAALRAFLQARGEPAWIGAAAGHPAASEVTRPLPGRDTLPADPAKSNLGFALFHDPRLSRDGTVTCASCHMGMLGEADVTAIVAFLNTLSSETFAGMSSRGGGMHEQMHQNGMQSQHMNHQQHHSQTMRFISMHWRLLRNHRPGSVPRWSALQQVRSPISISFRTNISNC